MDDMTEAPDPVLDTGLVRYLKWLVTGLTVTMIVGLLVLVAVVVMRFNAETTVNFPEAVALPKGVEAAAITRGSDWIAVVTTDDRILILSPDGQTLRQEISIAPAN